MKFHIILISDSDKHFADCAKEYTKRMGKQLTIQQVKPVKRGTTKQIIEKETDQLVQHIDRFDGKKRLLTRQGDQFTSEQFAKHLHHDYNHCFVIGGPYGCDEGKLSSHIDGTICFGKHTMPHGLVKVVLLEQIYRAKTIKEGKSYHY